MTGPSRSALAAANSIIAEALSRQTGERWMQLTPDDGDAVPGRSAGGGDPHLADQDGSDPAPVVYG
jgi:hypothetical protein